jgi:hypothetical protein
VCPASNPLSTAQLSTTPRFLPHTHSHVHFKVSLQPYYLSHFPILEISLFHKYEAFIIDPIPKMAEPTQMLILAIPASKPIEDPTSPAGTTWQEILELIRKSERYQRLYWGRHVEKLDNVQLHIGKDLFTPSLNAITTHPQPSSTHAQRSLTTSLTPQFLVSITRTSNT